VPQSSTLKMEEAGSSETLLLPNHTASQSQSHHGENSMPPHYPTPWYSVLWRQLQAGMKNSRPTVLYPVGRSIFDIYKVLLSE